MSKVKTPALMFQGTGSDVGKSLLVAGIARAYKRRGLTVRPFKPQNMSNNAAVTTDGGEIGRAQALQARAAGVDTSVHMNPVLLKPQSNMGSQVVVQGKVFATCKARDYYQLKPKLLPKVMESFEKLLSQADLVLIEGAGSPAEVNLRDGDIANMGFAIMANVPVILIADVDRGGVLASLVGTFELLTDGERDLLKGYIINKFRGDISLFEPALDIVKDRTNLANFGVVPWFEGAHQLPAEDAVALEKPTITSSNQKPIRIIVPRLDRISNFDDFDPLQAEDDVSVEFIKSGNPLPLDGDVILLPGSKTTISDLNAFRENGWDIDIAAHVRQGGMVVGICAGFQMLGQKISDPAGIEGPACTVAGLGLLDIETRLAGDKSLVGQTGIDLSTGAAVQGYEMHIGTTSGAGLNNPMLGLSGRPDGAISPNGRIMGCYLHGIFANDDYRAAFLNRLRKDRQSDIYYEQLVEDTLDQLADHVEAFIDLDKLLEIAKAH